MVRRTLTTGLLSLILGGCSASSMFTPYPYLLQDTKNAVAAGDYGTAMSELEEYRSDSDALLFMMERGRVAQLAGDYETSIEDFKVSMRGFSQAEERATISASRSLQAGGSLLSNEKAIDYDGEGYEKVMVHQFQAMNYLFLQDRSAALVEVRRANEQQGVLMREYEDELEGLSSDQSRAGGNAGKISSAYAAMNNVTRHVKNSFQNAYTFYVSGLIYEANGDLNDAYIDYKKALEIFPENQYVQQDVLRLAEALQMRDDLAHYKKLYSQNVIKPESRDGSVVVLYEQGFAPVKTEIRIGLFVLSSIQHITFPIYAEPWRPTEPLHARSGEVRLGESEPIVYIYALAAKALQEQGPMLLARQFLRLAMKANLARQSEKNFGLAGTIGATLYNVVSEQADRRSWLTLPNNAQILRHYLSAGQHQLELGTPGGRTVLDIRVETGHITLVRVVQTGNTLHTDAIVL